MTDSPSYARLLTAIRFAAEKHRTQRRKDSSDTPYINHPLEVAEILAVHGGVEDLSLLQAAVLHDTIEDTQTSPVEIEELFGADVRRLVEEVTDDKSLPKAVRKQLQIEHAPGLSRAARQLKLADKICNVRDLGRCAPKGWSVERCRAYFDWAAQVVGGCCGVNAKLDALFDQVLEQSQRAFGDEARPKICTPEEIVLNDPKDEESSDSSAVDTRARRESS